MPLSFPLSLADLRDQLRLTKDTLVPDFGIETSGQGSGVTREKDLRVMLWTADVTTVPMCTEDANDLFTLLQVIEDRGGTFQFYDSAHLLPRNGTLDDSGVKIRTLNVDGRSMSLKGVPAGARGFRGDMLSFTYGADSSQSLHGIVEAWVADGSGDTAEFEVTPGLPVGATIDDVVQLVKPFGIFKIAPLSLSRDDQDLNVEIISFTIKQNI